MSTFKHFLLEENDGVLLATINHPDKLNTLSQEALKELQSIIEIGLDNHDIKAFIITGSGERAFAAGADIAEFGELNEFNGRKFSEIGQETFALLENSNKPVIAAVNGYALGGGCELALACHLRILSENAQFGLPEAGLGILPGFGGTQRLPKLIGRAKALEIMMTGDKIDAYTAVKIGLANLVVRSHEELIPKCLDMISKIGQKAPLAIARIIESVNASVDTSINGYEVEANNFASCCGTKDFKEGATAFLEKRPAIFSGE